MELNEAPSRVPKAWGDFFNLEVDQATKFFGSRHSQRIKDFITIIIRSLINYPVLTLIIV